MLIICDYLGNFFSIIIFTLKSLNRTYINVYNIFLKIKTKKYSLGIHY